MGTQHLYQFKPHIHEHFPLLKIFFMFLVDFASLFQCLIQRSINDIMYIICKFSLFSNSF